MLQLNASSSRPPLEPMLPLINIVFLLLIFFLIAGNTQTPMESSIEVPINPLPNAAVTDQAYNWVYLDKNANLQYQGSSVASPEALATILKTNHKTIVLFADSNVSGGTLAKTLQALSAAEIQQISIVNSQPIHD